VQSLQRSTSGADVDLFSLSVVDICLRSMLIHGTTDSTLLLRVCITLDALLMGMSKLSKERQQAMFQLFDKLKIVEHIKSILLQWLDDETLCAGVCIMC
jgi:hypothetical protein